MVPSQEEHADALGVRTRADNQHVVNTTSTPTQEDHADALGCYKWKCSKYYNSSLKRLGIMGIHKVFTGYKVSKIR